ncbi:hypothetical protein FB567DRAFT_554626 [Paraphoma chrysanthemicola]|uniref:Transmembrane protein n=1 Tax=Paraphoma chrysanthemicola TaxID=798071 RepID=A0A8K0VS40_9PLEO|nr:hypothetical protein FB567DRAFT_554626 [Paraphoma chrysanthemicola]
MVYSGDSNSASSVHVLGKSIVAVSLINNGSFERGTLVSSRAAVLYGPARRRFDGSTLSSIEVKPGAKTSQILGIVDTCNRAVLDMRITLRELGDASEPDRNGQEDKSARGYRAMRGMMKRNAQGERETGGHSCDEDFESSDSFPHQASDVSPTNEATAHVSKDGDDLRQGVASGDPRLSIDREVHEGNKINAEESASDRQEANKNESLITSFAVKLVGENRPCHLCKPDSTFTLHDPRFPHATPQQSRPRQPQLRQPQPRQPQPRQHQSRQPQSRQHQSHPPQHVNLAARNNNLLLSAMLLGILEAVLRMFEFVFDQLCVAYAAHDYPVVCILCVAFVAIIIAAVLVVVYFGSNLAAVVRGVLGLILHWLRVAHDAHDFPVVFWIFLGAFAALVISAIATVVLPRNYWPGIHLRHPRLAMLIFGFCFMFEFQTIFCPWDILASTLMLLVWALCTAGIVLVKCVGWDTELRAVVLSQVDSPSTFCSSKCISTSPTKSSTFPSVKLKAVVPPASNVSQDGPDQRKHVKCARGKLRGSLDRREYIGEGQPPFGYGERRGVPTRHDSIDVCHGLVDKDIVFSQLAEPNRFTDGRRASTQSLQQHTRPGTGSGDKLQPDNLTKGTAQARHARVLPNRDGDGVPEHGEATYMAFAYFTTMRTHVRQERFGKSPE